MRKLLLLLIILVATLCLTACGSHHHAKPVTQSSPYQQVVPGHPCNPKNFYMQCQSQAAGQFSGVSPLAGIPLSFSPQFGIDFAWGGPSGSVARSLGAHFGISYLSGTSKDWSYYTLQSYKKAGIGVGFIWETTQYRPLSGCAGGFSDARDAAAEVSRYGLPHAPVFFAVDFDASAFSTSGTVGQYFHCARNVLGSRTGVYGGLRTMQIAAAQGIPANRRWQTLAWSWGRWTSACIHQYAIDRGWHGYRVDYNLALCQDWGQANVPPPPDPYRIYPQPNRHFAHHIVASEYNAVKTWDKFGCKNPVIRSVCKTTRRDLSLLSGRVFFLANNRMVNGHWAKRSHPRWDLPNTQQPYGFRFAGMIHRVNGK